MTGDHDIDTPPGFWQEAGAVLAELQAATATIAASKAAGTEVTAAVERVAALCSERAPEALGGSDPYLAEAFLAGAVGCVRAMWLGDEEKRRREVRIPLERTRQALRDLVAERFVALDRPPKEIARWVVEVTGVPQPEIAALVGVAPRTLQRWVSTTEEASPSGDEEMRLRTLARTVDQLRWSMTPVGVIRWLRRPHPGLMGRAPADLLDSPGAYAELPRLAARTRAMVAS